MAAGIQGHELATVALRPLFERPDEPLAKAQAAEPGIDHRFLYFAAMTPGGAARECELPCRCQLAICMHSQQSTGAESNLRGEIGPAGRRDARFKRGEEAQARTAANRAAQDAASASRCAYKAVTSRDSIATFASEFMTVSTRSSCGRASTAIVNAAFAEGA